jgi:hypothetical protein
VGLTLIELKAPCRSIKSRKEKEIPMINARTFVITVLGALLSSGPTICAQDVKPAEAKSMLQRPAMIQELALQPRSLLAFSLRADPVFAPLTDTPDLSSYRDFRFGMDLLAVAKQAQMQPSDARVIHQRPAVIQELEWRPPGSFAYSPQADPVQEVLFSFYNGELFRIVVNYDQIRTEGLTDEDMVEAISAKYGTATRPAAKVILFSSPQVYDDSENVIARWEDSQYSFNLFRSSYRPTFGMLVFSKRLDPLAQAAIVEAVRLDKEEAPQREIALQKKRDEENRARQAKARLVSKAAFRP